MGCVKGPGENPLRPGEIAIRMNQCAKCGRSIPFWYVSQVILLELMAGATEAVCQRCRKKN